jgi:uncharacterized protein YceH (UPF0502 family)
MIPQLTDVEARIIGCLIEKEVTTPDYYPLTLNSLTSACNQKSNRDPVMNLTDTDVQNGLDSLIKRRLVSDESAFNSRASKYQHRFCNTEFGDLQFTEQQKGIVCCLLLRGAQTPGEIRTRTNRLCDFSDVHEVESELQALAEHAVGQLVIKLAREPGKRESRFAHLFCGEVTNIESENTAVFDNVAATENSSEVQQLRSELDELKAQVAEMQKVIDELT